VRGRRVLGLPGLAQGRLYSPCSTTRSTPLVTSRCSWPVRPLPPQRELAGSNLGEGATLPPPRCACVPAGEAPLPPRRRAETPGGAVSEAAPPLPLCRIGLPDGTASPPPPMRRIRPQAGTAALCPAARSATRRPRPPLGFHFFYREVDSIHGACE
jgi:hypothetical protein